MRALLTVYGEQKWCSKIWLRRKRKPNLNVEPYNLQTEVQNNTPQNPHTQQISTCHLSQSLLDTICMNFNMKK